MVNTDDNKAVQLFIDSDVGVDDALAILWLARQKNIKLLGITTVCGNNSVQDATNNALTVLDVINRQDIPVTMGAANPLVFPPIRFGQLIMGPDGLWGCQKKHDLARLPTDAPAAIAAAARKHPDMIIIALGPATNLAQAVQRFPEEMANVRILMMANLPFQTLRGAIQGAGFNAYADPHAIDVLLNHPCDFTILGPGAIDKVRVDNVDYLEKISKKTDPINQFIFSILKPYFYAESLGQKQAVIIYDLVLAMIAAKKESIKETVSGFGKISLHNDFTAGEISVRTDPQGKIFLKHSKHDLSELARLTFSNQDFNLSKTMQTLLDDIRDNIHLILEVDVDRIKTMIEQGFE
ncbi:nucleoside hydrolase [Legionella taurinensis]|uniref:Nucleoside hydrolase n=1 Tax=Legionella taurinensis TaxID=70611 RepID=A0A3A5L8G9_9GAMM|nr:nucleoside hydrolase [Legionella taurinensis]RJT47894.1 nucleoside hydrolase [Legionella taurinensis]RJT68108.1 nucleoside hydrolase [Legionella taurinensis]STY25720.1 inosine-uridine preferring nucleoside hydrolase [Legionella taurinensis]